MSRSHAALLVLRALRSAKSGQMSTVASSPLMKGTPVAAHLTESAPVFGSMIRRTFATSYLDKAEVTDRVLSVVKAFDKVEASKVRSSPGERGLSVRHKASSPVTDLYYTPCFGAPTSLADYPVGGVPEGPWARQPRYRRACDGH